MKEKSVYPLLQEQKLQEGFQDGSGENVIKSLQADLQSTNLGLCLYESQVNFLQY